MPGSDSSDHNHIHLDINYANDSDNATKNQMSGYSKVLAHILFY